MFETIYVYPLWVRIWHAFNALLILVLIVTGVSMQYSAPDNAFIRFDLAVQFHNICGILLTANYAWFILGNLITPNGKHYQIKSNGFNQRLAAQFKYYTFGIFKKENPPFPITRKRKFNPLQQFSYVAVMYFMVPIVIVTGWVYLYPDIFLVKFFGGNALKFNDFVHVIMGFFVSFFMFVHIYFCTIGTTWTSNFKSILNGYHEP
jgi:thiosulfate reductase cytochrome b subunit